MIINSWTPEMDELLLANWAKVSCTEIAYMLMQQFPKFGKLTRNSVIGRATRLRAKGVNIPKQPSPIRVPKRLIEVERPTALPTRPAFGCKWIEGEYNGPVCSEPVVTGTSWCPHHYARVFQPSTKKGSAA